MARPASIPPPNPVVSFNCPVPRPLASRCAWLCSDLGIKRTELLFHAINSFSFERGLDPLDEAIIRDFKAYSVQAQPAETGAEVGED